MRLPKLAIDNHQFTNVIIILLIISGIVSFINMPKSEDPQVQPAGSSIIVIYPGASPSDVEQLIIEPIEEVLNELDDIKEIVSDAGDGIGTTHIEFLAGSDGDEKYSDVVQKVNSVRQNLPKNIANLFTIQWTISDVSILQLALVSETAAYSELEKEMERLETTLEKTPGVKKVETWAIPDQEIRVSLNTEKLAQWKVPLKNVMGAIQDANSNIPGGQVDIGAKRLNIKTTGSYESIAQLENTIVHSFNGKVVYLGDVADIRQMPEDITYKARLNGARCVYLTVNQKVGTNIFQISDRIDEKLSEFEQSLPASIKLATVFDQTESVAYRVESFFMNLLQGIFLVGLVIFAAVNFRASLIVMAVIPISILIGIGFVDYSGFGLEQMSIAGLVIALGLLVDNAIVVTENSSRFMQMGYSKIEAAVKGTSQVGWALVSATATTVFAFLPIIMMKDITGDFIRSMPVTVVYTLIASLLLSLTLTPYLSAKFLKPINGKVKERPVRKVLNKFIETKYRAFLKSSLKRPKLLIISVLLVFVFSLMLFPLVGVSFFPKAEKPLFFINIDLPTGSSIDQTDIVTNDIETYLETLPQVKTVASNIGHGNPRIYYNLFVERHKPGHAHLFVELNTRDLDVMNKTVSDLREKFDQYPGAEIKVKELEQGPPIDAPIAIHIIGENLDILKELSQDVEAMVQAEKGAVNIVNPLGTTKSDVKIKINRDKAAMLGVRLSDIDVTVRACLAGLSVSEYRDKNGKSYDIVVRLPIEQHAILDDLDKIYVTSMLGEMIPLNNLAKVELEASPLLISHYNLDRNVTITADVMSGFSTDQITTQIIEKLQNYQWPKGYSYSIGGERESQEESFGGMGQAVIIAMIAIFAVLVLQFRSYSQPLIVFSAIPLAIIGSILGLFLTGNSFSFSAFIGLTSLVGIVVNNSIILVDYSNQLLKEGKSIVEAVTIAGETRFTPIILTTATTIGGLLPLTLGGGTLWAPMGWTIIGGLLVSTFLTLIVVPVLFSLFTKRS